MIFHACEKRNFQQLTCSAISKGRHFVCGRCSRLEMFATMYMYVCRMKKEGFFFSPLFNDRVRWFYFGTPGFFVAFETEQITVAWQWRTEGGVWGVQTPPRNFEGPPKSCQTQPDCENC